MKRITFFAVVIFLTSCAELSIPTTFPFPQAQSSTTPKLTSAEVVEGLKEALKVGAKNSTALASKVDGFYKNPKIFIPFPPEAEKVKEKLIDAGFNKQVDRFTLTLNRAAEEATKKALPIFTDAIFKMTFTDAMSILNGPDNAATEYFRKTTSDNLYKAFKPVVSDAIKTVKLTSYWEPIATTYNRLTIITGGKAVNPDLEDYVTRKAIDGLFVLIEQEEQKIRKDPAARVTDILKKVFGNM
ncbi:MAG: hypothetical protein PWR03_1873 [Tenuifilum sp.]|uniref:DUF4197 domain-containing protein n=1 Tax=Tenuifilum sp. TaxID=2760880 RepID=UPI0024AC57B6|nr:DUF4197 domain-containing protein [Tenuifilum sp.]MDI3527690.1 hypothetical protein [Tenuifilum sp.]